MSVEERALRVRNLLTLGLLAGLFLLPLLLAFLTYYGSSWRPARHINHGVLLFPPRPLPGDALRTLSGSGGAPARALRGQWALVYLGPGDCASECRQALILMRQTRLALNQDMARVRRVLLVSSACCPSEYLTREHPGLEVLDATGATGTALLAQFPAADRAHTLFVVDPLGNLILSYDARRDPHGLLEDLKKLLRLSQIG